MTISHSIALKSLDPMSRCLNGALARFSNVSVTYEKDSQACHADLFPYPLKADVVSEPDKAWKTGNDLVLALPRYLYIVLTLKNW